MDRELWTLVVVLVRRAAIGHRERERKFDGTYLLTLAGAASTDLVGDRPEELAVLHACRIAADTVHDEQAVAVAVGGGVARPGVGVPAALARR